MKYKVKLKIVGLENPKSRYFFTESQNLIYLRKHKSAIAHPQYNSGRGSGSRY